MMLLSFSLCSAKSHHQWVKLGEHNVKEDYKTLYLLELFVPQNIHTINDIKKGNQDMLFKITWLPPSTTEEEVKTHFQNLIATQFTDPEDLKFNQIIIDRLLAKLSEAKRHDVWIFEYSPDAGTTVFIKDKQSHKIIGSKANGALHKAWLLSSPLVTAKLLNRLLKAN